MFKKNTRKRLLAGALATVMMLTMCPSWALADDEDIATPLPLVDENRPVVDSAPVEADTTKTPAVPTPSETEAKPAENQNTAPAPSDDEANGGTDSTETGNSTNPTVSEGSENNSQNNDVVSNSPENEISTQALQISLPEYGRKKAKYFVLLPKRGKPDDNRDQNQENYLPSSNDSKKNIVGSDGGVKGLDASTGYKGFVTKAGMQALKQTRDRSITNIEDGVPAEYLDIPDDLGFFTPGNWNSDGTVYNPSINTNTGEDARKALLDTTTFKFNPNNVTIVWYTIKDQSKWEYGRWVEDIHVDGYLKGVPVNVTYYSNYANNGIPGQVDTTFVDHQTSGDSYTIRDIHDDGMFEAPEGYSFGGWYTNQACTDEFEFTDTTTVLMTELNLYAKWVQNKFDVTYYVDGKKQVDATEKHAVGDNVNVSSTVPTKEGYTFKGWKTTNVTVINGTFTMPEQDVRFDAEFEKNKYTVTYYVDGEKYGAEQTYLYGDPVILAAKPTRDGFNFNGWLPEGVSFNTTGTGFQMPANNVVIRGTFDANSFYVAYYVDGIPYASELHKTGAKVTIRGDLAKDGFTFSGWTRDNVKAENFDMPAHNVEIHGSYRQNTHQYTIKKHFYDEKGVEIAELASTATAPGAENALIADLYKNDAVNQTVSGKTYVYVPGLTTPKDGTLTEDVTIDLHYYLNVEGGNDIPDAWEHRLTFKVVNGEWTNGGNADFVTYVQFKDQKTGEAFKDEAVVVPVTRIPAVGDKPNSGYHAGAWDTSPYDNYKVQKDTVFTYTYAKDSSGGSSGGHHRRPTVTIPDKVPTGLNGNDHYAYIVGYPDKTVRPQNGITRAEVATIFFRLLTDETRDANSTKSNSYSDVAAGAWYNHAVSTLSAMGIVKGDSDGKFNPNAPITRAEFAAIAARFDDKANTTTADFSDIASHWAKNEISAASNNGWINGYPDGTFRPDNQITRAEAMTLVNRVLKRLPETEEDLHDDMIKWSDNSDASQWFYLAVQEATNSHYYKAKENKSEKWTELRETRDWTELEK